MITVQQAAEKWGVSVRYVQALCKNGKLSGAVKFGSNWMLPADVERPKDRRYKCDDTAEEQDPAHKIVVPVQSPMMIMSPFYNKPGTANSCIKSLSAAPEIQALFSGQMAFMQGDVSKALELIMPLLDMDADFYGSLNIGMTLMAIAVWKNDNVMWAKGRECISSAPCNNDRDKKIRDIWLTITNNAIPAGPQELSDSLWTDFGNLPDDSIPLYLFYYAKYIHKVGINVAREETQLPDVQGMGVLRMFPYLAEPLIAYPRETGSILSKIYLHMLCADAYNKIGAKEKSEQHLDIAVSLCLPDKLYGVLAEYRGLMSNSLDDCLERNDREAAARVRKLEKEMYSNWIQMVNQTTDLGLSDRQKEIARLASIGLSNKEIVARLNISYNTVKSTITMIMNKTGASKRSEFSSYIY